MTLPSPGIVSDPAVQQALDSIRQQFPITGVLIGDVTIEDKHIVKESIEADKLKINELSAITANLGTVTAGLLEAVTIKGGTITGGTLKGALVEGNEIKGGTIEGVTIKGTTVEGGTIKGGTIEGSTIEGGEILGAKIVGGEISTAEEGVLPRIDLDSLGIRALIDVTDRVNLCTNPSAGGGATTGWTNTSLTTFAVATLGSGGAPEPGLGLLALGLFTGFHAVGDASADRARINFTTTTGHTYRVSAWVYVKPESTAPVELRLGTTTLALKSSAAAIEGEWQRLDLTYTETTGTIRWAGLRQEGAGASDFYFTAFLIEEEAEPAEVAPFFFPTPHQIETGSVEWTGTANASTSKLTAEETFYFDTVTGILLARGVLSSLDGSEIETKHLAGQIKETQITPEAISTPLLAANGVTAAKISVSNLAAINVNAGKITAGEIQAGALSVSTLSAISANLGTITAGTIKGNTIEGGTISGTKINALESFVLTEGSTQSNQNSLRWEGLDGKIGELVYGIGESVELENESRNLHLVAETSTAERVQLLLTAKRTKAGNKITANVGGNPATVFTGDEKSSFLQLTETAKLRIKFGTGEVSHSSGNDWYANFTHGLGFTPTEFYPFIAGGEFQAIVTADEFGATTVRIGKHRTDGASSTICKFNYIAVG